jgi:hypothetical protein
MDQGAISTFKAYYLWKTLKGITEAIRVSNNVTWRGYWRSHDSMKGVSNISAALSEV